MKILCTVCKQIKESTYFNRIYKNKKRGWCKECKNKSVRKYYHVHQKEINYKRKNIWKFKTSPKKYFKTQYNKFKYKFSARQKVKYAIKVGKLKKLPCVKCNKCPSDAHHPDYSKPLLVIWLCNFHHKEIHNQIYINEYPKI